MKGKRMLGSLLLAAMAVMLFGGCGMNKAGDQSLVDNASGQAVSGQAKAEAMYGGNGDYFYANSTNIYLEKIGNLDQDYEPIGFDQYTRDGKMTGKVRIKNFAALLAVTEKAVYYAKSLSNKDNGPQMLCRIPIEKNADGTDCVRPEKEEELLQEKYAFFSDKPMYVDDRCFVYTSFTGKESTGLIIYDRKLKKRTVVKEDVDAIVGYGDGYLYTLSDDGSGNFKLSSLEIDTAKWTDLEEPEEVLMPLPFHIGNNGNLYLCGDTGNIYCHQSGVQRGELLFSQEELEKVCQTVSPKITANPEYDGIASIYELFWQDNKLYIQIQCKWRQGEKRWDRYVMLSADLTEEKPELCYEQKLTECMWSNSIEEDTELSEEEDTKYYNWNSGKSLMLSEGKMIFLLNKGKSKTQQIGCYDCKKKEFTWVDKTKKEYYLPYSRSKLPFGEDDWMLEESFMGLMPSELGD